MTKTAFRRGFAASAASAIVLAASLFSGTVASAAGPTIRVDSVDSYVGGMAKVDVSIEDVGPPGVGAWTVDLHFDAEILTAVDCTSQQGGGICNEAYGPGTARVVGTNIHGLEGDASLAIAALSCKKAGESALTLTISVFVDATPGDPTDIETKVANGMAICAEQASKPTPTPPGSDPKVAGDANCDGEANALDAALVLQYVAGLLDELACVDADYNHDGRIDALDAALILQKDAGLID